MKKTLLITILTAFSTTAIANESYWDNFETILAGDGNVEAEYSTRDHKTHDLNVTNYNFQAKLISYKDIDFGYWRDSAEYTHDSFNMGKISSGLSISQDKDGLSWYINLGSSKSDWNVKNSSDDSPLMQRSDKKISVGGQSHLTSKYSVAGRVIRFGIAKQYKFDYFKVRPEFKHRLNLHFSNDSGFGRNNETEYKIGASIYGNVTPNLELGIRSYIKMHKDKIVGVVNKQYSKYNTNWGFDSGSYVKYSFPDGINITGGVENSSLKISNYYINLGYDF